VVPRSRDRRLRRPLDRRGDRRRRHAHAPESGNNGEIFYFDTSVLTDSIRIGAIGGDNAYSLSEVQVWGVVPAPGAFALLGLAGLSARRRR
jgi:hypothetical protein